MTASLLITGVPGLEDLLASELDDADEIVRASPAGHGLVRAEARDLHAIAALNLRLRQAERVLLLLGDAAGITDEADARDFTDGLDFTPHLQLPLTFAIRGHRRGQHDFGSQDLARVVGTAVVEQLRARLGGRIRADLEQPDVIFHAILHDDHLFIGLDTTGDDSLLQRYPRPFHHFAPLRPHLAAAMLRFARYDPSLRLLDPMAGGGTLPVEAAQLALHIPSTALREAPFAYARVPSLSHLSPPERGSSPDTDASPSITGADRFLKNVRGMRHNVSAAGLADVIQVRRADATAPEGYADVDLVVTNPPFGLRISDPRSVQRLYLEMLRAAESAGVPRYIALTPQRGFLRHAMSCTAYREVQHRHLHYGKLQAGLFEMRLDP